MACFRGAQNGPWSEGGLTQQHLTPIFRERGISLEFAPSPTGEGSLLAADGCVIPPLTGGVWGSPASPGLLPLLLLSPSPPRRGGARRAGVRPLYQTNPFPHRGRGGRVVHIPVPHLLSAVLRVLPAPNYAEGCGVVVVELFRAVALPGSNRAGEPGGAGGLAGRVFQAVLGTGLPIEAWGFHRLCGAGGDARGPSRRACGDAFDAGRGVGEGGDGQVKPCQEQGAPGEPGTVHRIDQDPQGRGAAPGDSRGEARKAQQLPLVAKGIGGNEGRIVFPQTVGQGFHAQFRKPVQGIIRRIGNAVRLRLEMFP